MDKFTVIADTREKPEHRWNFSAKDKYCAGTVVRKLDYGDYSVEGLEKNFFVIERKASIGELVGNLTTDKKRFYTLLENLSRRFRYKVIVAEFPYSHLLKYPWSLPVSKKTRSKIRVRPPFLISAVSSIFFEYDIPIYFMNNAVDAKTCALGLMKKAWVKFNK